jgi:hypothetical protein
MHIIQDSDDAQTLTIIPRELRDGAGFISFTDKTTKETFTYNGTWTIDRYYNQMSIAMPDLIEGHTYTISCGYDAVEIYRGFALCTNQTTYSLHDGEYTERTSTNDYIIL